MAWLSFTEQPVTFTIVIGVLVEVVVILQAAYKQIYSHPLSKYPGPTLGFLTAYRRTYIERVLGKPWHKELEQLHKKYGPIVRVGPNELHFSDPQAYQDIYNDSNRWDKEESYYHRSGNVTSSMGLLTYKEAKERRDALSKSFSSSVVVPQSPAVQEKVDSLCKAFKALVKNHSLVDLTWALRRSSLDIITYLTLGQSAEAVPRISTHLTSGQFAEAIYATGLEAVTRRIPSQIEELLIHPSELDRLPHKTTMYHALIDPELDIDERGQFQEMLYDEAKNLVSHGSDSVALVMTVIFRHLLQDQAALTRIKDEVKSIWPDKKSPAPSAKQLEALPYFNACLKEGLRLAINNTSPLPRVVPDGGAVIVGEQIPEDTIVSTDALCVQFNEDIFPDAHTFNPSRFINEATLDKWLVAFSRGPRSCLGIDLTWLVLRLTLASVVRRFDLELDVSEPQQLTFRKGRLPEFRGPRIIVRLALASS